MLSLEQYESDLPFLLGSNKKGWVRVCQILDTLLSDFGHVTSFL